jgi:signal transduction histidine kinase
LTATADAAQGIGAASEDASIQRGLRQKVWLILGFVAFALMAVLTLLAISAQSLATGTSMRLLSAHILVTEAEIAPADNADWQEQGLPDNWNRTRPNQGGFAWYRIGFDLKPEQIAITGIFIPRISMNGLVYLNGALIGGNGQFVEPMNRLWYQPQLFSVPQNLLKTGRNTIHIRLKAYAHNKGGLSEIYVGESATVTAQWRTREFWQLGSIKITSTVTLGLSLMALLAWSLQGWPSAYGYFGAAAMLWAVRNTHFLVTQVPFPAVYWEVITATSLIWVLVLIFMFVLRFAEQRLLWVERIVWAYAIAAPLGLWASGALKLTSMLGVVYGGLLLMGAYILKVLLSVAMRERTASTWLLFGASLSVYALGAHDWMAQRDTLNYSEPNNLHFGAPILFLAVALNMFARFGEAQRQARDLALSLDARVREKTRELEHSHAMLRQVEANQAKNQERGRIMQDMHDGLGSQLVSSLAMAQGGELSQQQTYDLLRSCIDDLRLAIDTSNDSRDSLALSLGNLRFRMEPRLKAAGIALKWNTLELRDDLPLPVEKQLPILRVIQETITNTLKHAQAKTLKVTVASSASDLVVEISDDGHGFDVKAATQTATGKGLNSLDKRARVLAAALHIESSSQGTRTRLTLPLSLKT